MGLIEDGTVRLQRDTLLRQDSSPTGTFVRPVFVHRSFHPIPVMRLCRYRLLPLTSRLIRPHPVVPQLPSAGYGASHTNTSEPTQYGRPRLTRRSNTF